MKCVTLRALLHAITSQLLHKSAKSLETQYRPIAALPRWEYRVNTIQMQVQVNGKPHTLDARKTITELLTELQVSREQGIAIAINEQVVSRREFDETYVEDGDEVEIIQATSGG